MGRKIHPKLYRLGINQDWNSHWFAPKGRFGFYLKADTCIRDMVLKLFPKGVIERVAIERSPSILKVVIFTPRPGLVVGRQGVQIKKIEEQITSFVKQHIESRGRSEGIVSDKSISPASGKKAVRISIEIQEIKEPELYAHLISQEIAAQLERRMPYKRILKQSLARLMRHKGVKGAKLKVKGRLGGADIARAEWVFAGSVPLQTLRSDISYGFSEAITKWGVVGVKVWIYKGEVFDSPKDANEF